MVTPDPSLSKKGVNLGAPTKIVAVLGDPIVSAVVRGLERGHYATLAQTNNQALAGMFRTANGSLVNLEIQLAKSPIRRDEKSNLYLSAGLVGTNVSFQVQSQPDGQLCGGIYVNPAAKAVDVVRLVEEWLHCNLPTTGIPVRHATGFLRD